MSSLTVKPLKTLEEALAVAAIRNGCRKLMTGSQEEISPARQREWFQNEYTTQSAYRVWILRDRDGLRGYFAAKEARNGYAITEAIDPVHQGKGLGRFLLNRMIQETFSQSLLYAEIFNHNTPSIKLHAGAGFHPIQALSDTVTLYKRTPA